MKISGGISNLSFSFRGNDVVREAIHSAFLFHAIKAGLDMGIVNAGQLIVYEDIPKDLLEHVEDIIFNRRPDATERMVAFAEQVKGTGHEARNRSAWREGTVEARLSHALVHGIVDFIEQDAEEARVKYGRPLLGDRRAADGRHEDRRRAVRRRQDVPAAGGEERTRDEARRRVSRAVHGSREGRRSGRGGAAEGASGKLLIATVKGDVHDIGKNIVGVVLGCNNYEVIDLGVMVPADKILQEAVDSKVDIVGLSGLITPSLDEMVFVAAEMERAAHDAAAADRRRHHQPAAHGGQDRAGVLAADRARARRVARGRRRRQPAERASRSRRSTAANRAAQAKLREQHAGPQRSADAAIAKAREPTGCGSTSQVAGRAVVHRR